MIKEKNPLLELEFKKQNIILSNIFNNFCEAFYALYNFILQDPIENFWYECFSVLLSYLQLISFLFSEAVSLIKKYQSTKFFYSFGQYGIKKT